MKKEIILCRITIIGAICAILYILLKVSLEKSMQMTDGLYINEIMPNALAFKGSEAGCCDWIELYNNSDQAVNLEGYGLSDIPGNPFRWKFPSIDIDEGGYLVIAASADKLDYDGLCCGYALDKEGGEVTLTAPDGEKIDTIIYGKTECDVSYGRSANNTDFFGTFLTPTPGEENGILITKNDKMDKEVPQVRLGLESGFYQPGTEVVMEADDHATILYTLDGSIPTVKSAIYREPVKLEVREGFDAVVIRAAAYRENSIGPVTTATYFLCDKSKYHLSEVSLVVDPDLLFGDDGIFVSGNTAKLFTARGYKAEASNVMLNTKINATLQFENSNGWQSTEGKIKLSGVSSRGYAEKNLVLQMEEPYEAGEDKLVASVNLKAQGAGDPMIYCKSSAFIEGAASGLDIGTRRAHFVNLFIDGEYWGIYYIQEGINSYYNRHYGVSDSERITVKISPDFLGEKNDYGNARLCVEYDNATSNEKAEYEIFYNNIISNTADLEYDWIYEHIDMNNFMDYVATQLFWANVDWPQNNIEMWRSKTVDEDNPYADMRWRWRLYDMDCCMAGWLGASGDYIRWDALGSLLSIECKKDEEVYLTAALFQKLWDDPGFRVCFKNRFLELLDTVYCEETLLDQFREHKALIQSDIEISLYKLNSGFVQANEGKSIPKTLDEWNENMEYFEKFIKGRGKYCREMIQEHG